MTNTSSDATVRKSLSELSKDFDLELIQGVGFRNLVALAHAEGLLSGVLQDAGVDPRTLILHEATTYRLSPEALLTEG